VSANYRSSPPTHQQYLDINGKKRKKHNKQAKAAFFSFLVVVLQIDCSLN